MKSSTVTTPSSLSNYRVLAAVKPATDTREAVQAIRQRWLSMSEQEVELEIAVAKATDSDVRSAELKIICKAGCNLRALVREDRAIQARTLLPADDPSLLRMSQFEGLEALQTCSVDVDTGALRVLSLRAFAHEGHACTLSLILLGRPGTGKTPLSLSLCALLAKAWPREDAEHTSRQIAVTSPEDSLRPLVGASCSGV